MRTGVLLVLFRLHVVLCQGNGSLHCDSLLDKSNFDSIFGIHPIGCHLYEYKPEDVVSCVDEMLGNQSRWLHFMFIGDSRIRYQFYSFLQFIPQYDMAWKGSPERHKVLDHMHVIIPTLDLIVSYRWRVVINETVVSEFVRWSTPPFDYTPDLIMIGMSAHHMLARNGADHRLFENMLQRIAERIRIISNRSKIIWMNQQPLVEALTVNKESLVTSNKLEQYNRAAKRILKDTGAVFWDSGNRLAEEYTRACMLQSRTDKLWHQNCYDYIHTGFVALARGTQIFLNFLCNKFVGPSRFEPERNICCSH